VWSAQNGLRASTAYWGIGRGVHIGEGKVNVIRERRGN
jgi:hypothetical protein